MQKSRFNILTSRFSFILKLFKGDNSKKMKVLTQEDVLKSKHFCIIPWIHVHIMPDSSITPCCLTQYDEVYGYASKDGIGNVWNNKMFKTMRKLKLMDRPVHSCRKCYEVEESNILSMRKRFNKLFIDSFKIALTTEPDGHVNNLKMKYFDVRFSNICNFKCRGCSPTLSTKWYEDHQKLWDYKSEAPKLINFTKKTPPLWKEIEGYLPYVETAYFAGGEPLLMDEHYECLEKFIELKKTDVLLEYNTNLSILKFKKYDILDLWSQFENVNISVSLDDIEERGEYFRSGLNWDTFLKNCLIIKERFPHFIFTVNCTISVFNIHRIPEIHHELFSRGIINSMGFNFNTLLDPIHYRTQVATKKLKVKTYTKLQNYIIELKRSYPNTDWSHFKAALTNQIHFMNSADLSHKLNEFKKVTINLDKIRNESFSKTYPELEELLN